MLASRWRELLKHDLDAVVVSVPVRDRYRVTLQAIKAGPHLFAEMPMAASRRQAERLVAAAAENGVMLHANLPLHHVPAYVLIGKMVATGRIGRPVHVRISWTGHALDPERLGRDVGLVLHHNGISPVIQVALHLAELMGWWMGGVFSVSALRSS